MTPTWKKAARNPPPDRAKPGEGREQERGGREQWPDPRSVHQQNVGNHADRRAHADQQNKAGLDQENVGICPLDGWPTA